MTLDELVPAALTAEHV